jgi:uncharacterized lipoprotein YmbA
MSHPNSHLPRFLALCAAICLLANAGCNVVPPAQEDPTRYFVLSGAELPALSAVQAPAGTLRVGIRTVRLESYLNRKEMVVRTGANEVRFEDYRRWADPLDAAVTRIVRSRLLAAPTVAQVFAEPFPFDQARDFDVSIDVVRFEGTMTADGKFASSMAAVVEISTTGAASRIVSRKLFEAPAEGWDGTDFDRLAALLRADVDLLAQEVASELPGKP